MFDIFKSHRQRALDMEAVLISVGVKDTDACYQWAFGDGWMSLPVRESDEKWNERHSDLFILCGSDGIIDGLERIGRAYVKEVMR